MQKILIATAALMIVGAALLAGGISAAYADVQVCHGTDDCTVVTPQGSRTMSVTEARNLARSNARNDLYRVGGSCPVAADPARCQQLMRELLEQFRPR